MNGDIALPLCLALAAVVYGSVGQGAATSYLVVMPLAGLPLLVIKPASLCLNLVVSVIAWIHYSRGGWKIPLITYSFILGSVPAAMLGARLVISEWIVALIISASLILGAIRMLFGPQEASITQSNLPRGLAVSSGAVIGLLAGLAGIGGGVFLSPILIFTHWANPRQVTGICAVFIFVNSLAALICKPQKLQHLPDSFYLWVAAVAIGGLIGSYVAQRLIAFQMVRVGLAIALILAALRLSGPSLVADLQRQTLPSAIFSDAPTHKACPWPFI
jgi:uncharacterized protein